MKQQEIFQNMTKGEWRMRLRGTQPPVIMRLTDYDKVPDHIICEMHPNTPIRTYTDAEAICTAVNWWQKLMKQGINPESVEKMRTALQAFADYASTSPESVNIPNELKWQIKEALTAAKLV